MHEKQELDDDHDANECINEKGAAVSADQGDILAGALMKVAGQLDKQLLQSSAMRRMSAESQDFEFNKVVGGMVACTGEDDKEGGDKQNMLSSADELFYKGQLLPLDLQSNMSAWANKQLKNMQESSAINANYKASMAEEEPLSSQFLVSREQDVRFSSSCRMDHLNHLHSQLLQEAEEDPSSLFDLRCSSFRSHSSKYSSYYCHYYANYASNSSCSSTSTQYSACAAAAGDSSTGTSSRDSNGSSHDSAPPPACSTTTHIRDPVFCSCSCHAGPKRKPLGFLHSWRLLLHGLKRGSSTPHPHQNSSKASTIHAGLQRAPHAATPANSSSERIKPTQQSANQGLSACGCKAVVQQQDHKSSTEVKRPGTEAEASSGLTNGASNIKSSKWQRRIKPNLSTIKARLVGGNRAAVGQELPAVDQDQAEEKAWTSNTKRRVTRKPSSLDRKFSQPSLVCEAASSVLSNSVKGLSASLQVSFRFHAGAHGGGAAAISSSSCPASVISSPNHSGLLISPAPPPMSSMQELHSAVQGAIAHCKQSNYNTISSISSSSSSTLPAPCTTSSSS